MAKCRHLESPFASCKLDNTICDRRLEGLKGECPKLSKIAEPTMAETNLKPARDAKGHFIKKEDK